MKYLQSYNASRIILYPMLYFLETARSTTNTCRIYIFQNVLLHLRIPQHGTHLLLTWDTLFPFRMCQLLPETSIFSTFVTARLVIYIDGIAVVIDTIKLPASLESLVGERLNDGTLCSHAVVNFRAGGSTQYMASYRCESGILYHHSLPVTHHTIYTCTYNISTYKFERQHFLYGHRNAPTFCTHVRIDNLTLKKWTHPTPGG